MKKTTILAVLIFTLASSAWAIRYTLNTGNIVSLIQDEEEIIITIDYPGLPAISNICGVKIIASETLNVASANRLKDALLVEDGFTFDGNQIALSGKVDEGTGSPISYKLSTERTYMTNVKISTKSGKSLRAEILGLLGLSSDALVGIVTTPCAVR